MSLCELNNARVIRMIADYPPREGCIEHKTYSKKQFLDICYYTEEYVYKLFEAIPCNLGVSYVTINETNNANDTTDPSTYLGRLTSEISDISDGPFIITEERFQRIKFQFPTSFTKLEVIFGEKALLKRAESPFLLFTPFSWETWLCVGAVSLFLALFGFRKELKPYLGFFARNLMLFAVLYTTNLRALLSVSENAQYPFTTFPEFLDQFEEGKFTFVIDAMDDFRFSIINSSQSSMMVRFRKALKTNGILIRPAAQISRLIATSGDYVTLNSRDNFYIELMGDDNFMYEDLGKFEIVDIFPASALLSGLGVSNHRRDLVEELSRLSEVMSRLEIIWLEERDAQRAMVRKSFSTQTPLIKQKHFKLIYFIAAAGYTISILAFLSEKLSRVQFRWRRTPTPLAEKELDDLWEGLFLKPPIRISYNYQRQPIEIEA